MIALLELILLVLLLPYILFGVLLAKIADLIGALMEEKLLCLAIWLFILGAVLWPRRIPDDKPWVDLAGSIAQISVFGFTTPVWLMVIGLFALIASFLVRLMQKPEKN
jgi:hypothetical protein